MGIDSSWRRRLIANKNQKNDESVQDANEDVGAPTS